MTKSKIKLRPGMTARELMTMLEADPEWVARRDKREAELQARIAENRRIEAPLIADLSDAGHEVNSVWDLVQTSRPYPDALPVLVKHLQREYPPGIRDGIARALGVYDAKFAWPIMVEQYINETESRPRGGLAAALAAIAMSHDDLLPEIISLIKDTSQGSSRVLLVYALYRTKHPIGLATLVEMKDDPVLAAEIGDLLKKVAKRKRSRTPKSKLH